VTEKSGDKRSLGRANNIVLAAFTKDELVELWDEHKTNITEADNSAAVRPCSSCWLWQGSTQNGYPSVSQGHGKSKIKVHILAAWSRLEKLPASAEVTSHRCHRKLCINPRHLVIESITANNERKGCLCAFVDSADQRFSACVGTSRAVCFPTQRLYATLSLAPFL